MAERFQKIARFVKSQVAILSQAQYTEVDGSLLGHGGTYGLAFPIVILGIGWETEVTILRDGQGIQQLLSDKMLTGDRVILRNSAPFIQFDDSHLIKQSGLGPVSDDQSFIESLRGRSCGSTEQQSRL